MEDNGKIEIINLLAFCMTFDGTLGIAEEGTFAARAWRISDEAFNAVMGTKFSWTAPDGGYYTDSRDVFKRPTEEQVRAKLNGRLLEKAIEKGLVKQS